MFNLICDFIFLIFLTLILRSVFVVLMSIFVTYLYNIVDRVFSDSVVVVAVNMAASRRKSLLAAAAVAASVAQISISNAIVVLDGFCSMHFLPLML